MRVFWAMLPTLVFLQEHQASRCCCKHTKGGNETQKKDHVHES